MPRDSNTRRNDLRATRKVALGVPPHRTALPVIDKAALEHVLRIAAVTCIGAADNAPDAIGVGLDLEDADEVADADAVRAEGAACLAEARGGHELPGADSFALALL